MARRCNGGDRGNSTDRRRRSEWLVNTFRADVDASPLLGVNVNGYRPLAVNVGEGLPACRCFRCGKLLTVETVTADRIKPGIDGGTYRRDNIRPACQRCQSITGNEIRAARTKG